ncbi:hypothetical protein MNBD_GAMMA12-662 [hydrothermal vent metagenome]|uniref:NERD domain-containing protein n=1 Tax=hydrothermal vent metagenome TaxID=652676 RepID=A0A3B0YID5_9ZZZZ
MMSVYQIFNNLIPGVSGIILFWAIIVTVVVAAAVTYFLKTSSSKSGDRKALSKKISESVTEIISAVSLHDEAEGEFHYDHICLTSTGILVVDVKDFRGLLFGGANTDQWTQVLGSRSYKFENPLYHNREKVQTVKALIDEEIPVFGCVVFTSAGAFPKDQPKGVYTHNKFDEEFEYSKHSDNVSAQFTKVWQVLTSGVSPIAEK